MDFFWPTRRFVFLCQGGHRQHMREHFKTKARVRRHQFAGNHIHYALCGHGGERWIDGCPVDGYVPSTKKLFQYHGCHRHGCLRCFPNNRNEFVSHGQTREQKYLATVTERTTELLELGFRVVEKWECETKNTEDPVPNQETGTYPLAIFYDFESYLDKTVYRHTNYKVYRYAYYTTEN